MLSFFIDGNTFEQPFSITNTSDDGELVTRFQLDLSPIDLCYDEGDDGTANCNTSLGVAFTPQGGTGAATGQSSHSVSADLNLLDITFTDFDAGETFSWDIDIDHDPGAGSATALGSDMIGALATIDFSDGQRLFGNLEAVPGNADAARFTVAGITVTPVPVNSSIALMLLGVAGIGFTRFSRKRAS